jgi:hypothetical protein
MVNSSSRVLSLSPALWGLLGLPLQMTSNGTKTRCLLTFSFFSLILLCAMGTKRAITKNQSTG